MIELFLQYEKHKIYKVPSRVENQGSIFSIEDRLDCGGNAVVHKCINQATGDEYAIKFLLHDSAKNKTRFKRECFALEGCGHPHIISYLCSGRIKSIRNQRKRVYEKNLSYLIMELSDNGNLMKFVRKSIKIDSNIYHAQFRGLVEALSTLHNQDIIHRDIKPQNILCVGNRWVISDLGLNSIINKSQPDLTNENENIGPRFWMSPEAMNRSIGVKGRFAKIGKTSDVFQLASFFWFVTTRLHPSGIPLEKDWRGKKEVYKVLVKALQQNPKNRYADAQGFRDDLIAAIES